MPLLVGWMGFGLWDERLSAHTIAALAALHSAALAVAYASNHVYVLGAVTALVSVFPGAVTAFAGDTRYLWLFFAVQCMAAALALARAAPWRSAMCSFVCAATLVYALLARLLRWDIVFSSTADGANTIGAEAALWLLVVVLLLSFGILHCVTAGGHGAD